MSEIICAGWKYVNLSKSLITQLFAETLNKYWIEVTVHCSLTLIKTTMLSWLSCSDLIYLQNKQLRLTYPKCLSVINIPTWLYCIVEKFRKEFIFTNFFSIKIKSPTKKILTLNLTSKEDKNQTLGLALGILK